MKWESKNNLLKMWLLLAPIVKCIQKHQFEYNFLISIFIKKDNKKRTEIKAY